ncbi:hypothetical protein [Parerythrobacter jejuensis]|uniref:Uncharacterized protein n=1 Tax=Parerythrobacter jejuensis TaxID=795812 RepID=A0A845ASS7_9SPHN|nr:hypothetical protein [Parerythrobacter jejuensis]MXP32644.1 hypothetical protein [Parerythrobacter jejuensis]
MPTHIPSCPACEHPASPKLLFWGLHKPFDCRGCGRLLVVPKAGTATLAITAYLVYFKFKQGMTGTQEFGLILAISAVILILSWIAMRPKLAKPESDD